MLNYTQTIKEAVKLFYDPDSDYHCLGSEAKHNINNVCYLIATIYDKGFAQTKRKFAQQYKEYQHEKEENSFYFWCAQMERQKREEEAAKKFFGKE